MRRGRHLSAVLGPPSWRCQWSAVEPRRAGRLLTHSVNIAYAFAISQGLCGVPQMQRDGAFHSSGSAWWGLLGVEDVARGRECGRGKLRAKNRTEAPPCPAQGLSSQTGWDLSASGDRGRDAAGTWWAEAGGLGLGCRKEPSRRTHPAVQRTVSKGAKEPWAQFQRQPYPRGAGVRGTLEATAGLGDLQSQVGTCLFM